MKRSLIISVAVHIGVIGVLFLVGRLQSKPMMRGYPRTITAMLVEKPAMKQPQKTQAPPEPVKSKPEPTPKPVPSTKPPTKKETPVPKPKKTEPQPAQNVPPSTEKNPAADNAASGGNALKIDAPEFPYPHYLALLQFRIETHWAPPFSGQGTHLATVYFKIARNGDLLEVKLEKSSGSLVFDQAAMRAVHSSNPLPPLPTGSGLETLGVHFDFVAY
jgi:TonB family protein